jgi:anti-sigma B factor antagonist
VTDVTSESLREALRPSGPVSFGLDVSRTGGVVAVSVQGELDLLTAPKLLAELSVLLREEAADVVLDLVDTVFLDSAGLAILLNLQRRVERGGKRLRVMCEDGPVRRVIEFARLEEALGLMDGR